MSETSTEVVAAEPKGKRAKKPPETPVATATADAEPEFRRGDWVDYWMSAFDNLEAQPAQVIKKFVDSDGTANYWVNVHFHGEIHGHSSVKASREPKHHTITPRE